MTVFEIVSNAAIALIGLFFIIAAFDHLKPGMSYTESLFAVWFYSTMLLAAFIAYRVAMTGMI